MEKSGSGSFTLSWWPFVLAFLVLCFCSETCNAKDDRKFSCTSSCGLIHNITYPFRLNDDPKKCGDRRYTLSCENNITVLDLPSSGKYHVHAINYKNHTIRLLDPGLDNNNCSSLPQNWPSSSGNYPLSKSGQLPSSGNYPLSIIVPLLYLSCRNPVNSTLYVDTAPCLNNSATSLIQPKSYSYVMVYSQMEDLYEGCRVEWKASMLWDYFKGYYYNASYSYENIHSALMYGFDLQVNWPDELGSPCNYSSYYTYSSTQLKCFPRTIPGSFQYNWLAFRNFMTETVDLGFLPRWFPFHYVGKTEFGWEILIGIALFFPARLLFGIPIVAVFLVYKWRRRHLSMYSTIEDFLQHDKSFMPIRYSYSDIKKMTRKFKDKLGEGGYGSVFKGK